LGAAKSAVIKYYYTGWKDIKKTKDFDRFIILCNKILFGYFLADELYQGGRQNMDATLSHQLNLLPLARHLFLIIFFDGKLNEVD